jgi:hypothetical protein
LTTQPAVVAVIFCSRFGWDDFLTAIWLRRTDPHRARAAACSWFCLALATTRILVAAFGFTMFVTVVLVLLQVLLQGGRPNQNANRDLPAGLSGLIYLMIGGLPILGFFALLGSVAARRGGVRVWVDANLSRTRHDNLWPPKYSSGLVDSLQNKARLAWLSMLAIVVVVALGLSVIVVITVGPTAGAIVLAAESVLISFVTRGVIAQHPADCWGIPAPDA